MSAETGSQMSRRKTQHLEICLDGEQYHVETGTTRLAEVHPVHRSLPEVDSREVDPSTEFLGRPVAMPVFISSMTGGSEAAYRTNKDLAAVAEALGIPVGMGSMRILFRNPDVLDHFRLKRYAPGVPVFTNIGAVQLPHMSHDEIFRMADTLEVDGIAVHLNPGQEIFQPEGDTDFAGVLDALGRFIERSPMPVLVKETGFGINPREIQTLRELGAAYVDIAGSGGTNWIRVEAYRDADPVVAEAAAEFDEWGLPTGLLLAALGREQRGILASGGIRTGMDVVRALMLGAEGVGLALPFVRAVKRGGVERAIEFGRRLDYVIRTAMTLTGCRRVAELRSAPIWLEDALRRDAEALRTALVHHTPV